MDLEEKESWIKVVGLRKVRSIKLLGLRIKSFGLSLLDSRKKKVLDYACWTQEKCWLKFVGLRRRA